MIVVTDIDLIMHFRALKLLDNEFTISCFYLANNYLEPVQKQIIKELEVSDKIQVFEVGNDFYNFYSKYDAPNFPMEEADMSSVFYSITNQVPLLTECPVIKKFAIEQGVKIYELDEVLSILKIGNQQIEMIKRLIIM